MSPVIEMQEELLRLLAREAGRSTTDVANLVDRDWLKRTASAMVELIKELDDTED